MTNVTLLTYKATKLMNGTPAVGHCYVPKSDFYHIIWARRTILNNATSYFTFSKPQLRPHFITIPSPKILTTLSNLKI